ncbi:MAG TPA: chemotaxis response regulator protein-glutamate methylesterase [Coriobacteriia bacterium]|nr:MAG: Chemotaxis response regulator protein-glutamate methylesterase [Actinobacteria bacterium 66_15]HAL30878.1 chemotaxis response regulator protein-glutamate methylesterase [Coriobacteriia bacterium]
MRSTIKVLVVDDSALTRQLLTRALSVDPAIEIVGTARTGVEAIEKTHSLAPDVVTLDIEMPELTGLEALPHIIRTSPARVLMLSSVDNPDTTYAALELGATDFVVKSASGFVSSLTELSEVLIKKIKTAYRVRPERRRVARREELYRAAGVTRPAGGGPPGHLVAIAASTGGPPALEVVVSGLDTGLDASYMIVQHLPKGFTGSLARRLGRIAPIPVVEAEDGMPVERDTAYIAPHGRHMTVAGGRTMRMSLQDAPPLHGVRPAADPLFMSVADRVGKDSVGVVLTGMGTDGAAGLRSMKEAGGTTIVQDEESSVVWGMPGAAVRMGVASRVVPIDDVAGEIRRAVRG